MTWNGTAQAHLESRAPVGVRWLLWIDGKELTSPFDPVSTGFWTGDDDLEFTIGGSPRTYRGAQGVMTVAPIRYVPGTTVGTLEVSLGLSPEVEDLVRGANIRFAPADLYCALFDPADWSLLDTRRFFKGFVDGSPIFTGALGGASSCTLKLVSAARLGTMTESGKKSDQSQRQRSDDRFRRYGDIAAADDPWGAKSEGGTGSTSLLKTLAGRLTSWRS